MQAILTYGMDCSPWKLSHSSHVMVGFYSSGDCHEVKDLAFEIYNISSVYIYSAVAHL